MGMNETPSANRTHIGIFGKTNAGKSSIFNAITGQGISIVSGQAGTTTDPVSKAMELLPLGPVIVTDTPGLGDDGELGGKRMEKMSQALRKTDVAVLVVDGMDQAGRKEPDEEEQSLLAHFAAHKIPFVIAVNKSECLTKEEQARIGAWFQNMGRVLFVSAKTGQNITELKECIAGLIPAEDMTLRLIGDLLSPMDIAVLVVPIDSAAPKGRLILPQQQVIRDCLEAGAIPVVTRETELSAALLSLAKKPKVVVTDSQAFERVAKEVPEDIFLTSFSILFSRYKGGLKRQTDGARALAALKDGDTVLISEGCTHHRQCGDIGTVKLPRLIRKFTGKDIRFEFTSGIQFPDDISHYALVIHCGGCMLNGREMAYRLRRAAECDIPMTNYGIALAAMHGILERSLEIFR